MACCRIVLLIAAVACLVECGSHGPINVDKWQKVMTVQTNTLVKDGQDKPVVSIVANTTVYGDFNKTQDQDVLASLVVDKLSVFERRPMDSIKEQFVPNSPLPLLLDLSVKEVVTVGPKPVKEFAVILDVHVYAKKNSTQDAFSVIKSFKSSF